MDNQHRQIKGYRELTQAEIDLMNEIKAMGPQMQALCEKVKLHVETQYLNAKQEAERSGDSTELDRLNSADPVLWMNWGRDGMKLCLMQLTRAVAQPTFF